MQNPRLAGRYAKSLLDLAKEQNSLEATLADVELLEATVRENRELGVMLRSPVIKGDKKQAVLKAIFGDKLGKVTGAFVNLLVSKGRESSLPEILAAFLSQYKEMKNIKVVKLTTASAVDDKVKETIRQKVAASMPDKTIEMTTSVNPELVGGFVLEMDGKVVDASIRRDLMDIRKNFLDNHYVPNIR